MDKLLPAERERNTFLFWNCYVMDRNTSLRLGRAPIIPEFDITAPRPKESKGLSDSLKHLLEYWVEMGRIQGRICEHLYSPAALIRPQHERDSIALSCKAELDEAFAERIRVQDIIRPRTGTNWDSFATLDPILAGDQLMHASTLALTLQSVATTPEAKEAALRCARDCLQTSTDLAKLHQRNIYSWVTYIHWVVLHSPMMTPFTVVFSHIIGDTEAVTATEDLQLLQDFVATLEPARKLCEGTDKFSQLCNVFCDAAKAYLEVKRTKNKQDVVINTSAIDEFDQVLADMGLATTVSNNNLGHFANGASTTTDSLQDWYNANSSLYNLLDQDFGTFSNLDFGVDYTKF